MYPSAFSIFDASFSCRLNLVLIFSPFEVGFSFSSCVFHVLKKYPHKNIRQNQTFQERHVIDEYIRPPEYLPQPKSRYPFPWSLNVYGPPPFLGKFHCFYSCIL